MSNFRDIAWRPRHERIHRDVPPRLKPWLDEQHSLTARLRAHCRGRFHVRVLSQRWARPTGDERRELLIPLPQRAFIREVLLLCDDVPWVFARSVIPLRSATGAQRRLLYLRDRSLGSVLFAEPGLRRGPLEVRPLGTDDPWLKPWGLQPAPGRRLWARRSQLAVGDRPLLVAEVFLPDLNYGEAYGHR